jgi:tetratricopeptide (TPR) repeat protein
MRAAGVTAARSGSRFPRRIIGWTAAALAAVGAIAAADRQAWFAVPAANAAPLDPAVLVAGYGPATFDAALTAAETKVGAKRELLAREPGDWLRMEGLARALLQRARLTASAPDMAEANRLLARGVDRAPWPAGPVLSRAGAALTVHDLATAERTLDRFDAAAVPAPASEAAEARGIRCEIAFERGTFAQARSLCGDGGDLSLDLRRANMALASGDHGRAAALVEAALRQPRQTPLQLANLMLQRTAIALAAGKWPEAERWARAADRAFPGYWLAQAYVAQSRALAGDTAGAEQAYRAIAGRTGNPDVYGALAVLAKERGDGKAERAYLEKAGEGWARRVALLPATYANHYAEYQALTGDLGGALRTGADDYARRPFLPVITDYVFVLGEAQDWGRIVEVVQRGELDGYRSATLMLAQAKALGKLGRANDAARVRAAALRLNPRIEDPRQAFVHFRQD